MTASAGAACHGSERGSVIGPAVGDISLNSPVP